MKLAFSFLAVIFLAVPAISHAEAGERFFYQHDALGLVEGFLNVSEAQLLTGVDDNGNPCHVTLVTTVDGTRFVPSANASGLSFLVKRGISSELTGGILDNSLSATNEVDDVDSPMAGMYTVAHTLFITKDEQGNIQQVAIAKVHQMDNAMEPLGKFLCTRSN